VLADKHIARRQQNLDRFTQQQNELVTELACGKIWSRPRLPLKLRSLVTIGMLPLSTVQTN
jgi:alkylhydroperoxidase/carboxymuconolactone decarboxylase family protein YurZ